MNEKQNINAVVAMILCVVFYVGYSEYLSQKYPTLDQTKQASTEKPGTVDSGEARQGTREEMTNQPTLDPVAPPPQQPEEMLPPGELVVETDISKVRFAQSPPGFAYYQIKAYRENLVDDKPVSIMNSPMALVPILGFPDPETPVDESGNKRLIFKQPALVKTSKDGSTLTYTFRDGLLTIEERIELNDGYAPKVSIKTTNTGTKTEELVFGLRMSEYIVFPESAGFGPASFVAQRKQMILGQGGDLETIDIQAYCDEKDPDHLQGLVQQVDFIGIDKHYFVAAMEPRDTKISYISGYSKRDPQGCQIDINMYLEYGSIAPGQSAQLEFDSFFGPKQMGELTARNEALKATIDFGIFRVLAYPLLLGLKTSHSLTNNWGLAIIIITILLKILFYPLTKKAAVSAKKMQKLNPQMQQLREKYKEDQARLQKEMMAFMKKHKFNPAAGCLPILPQIPVFIAFYNVLSQSIELRQAPFFGWINDLSVMDPYYVTPILLGVLMFLNQKITPTASMDKNQERVMMMMPIFFSFMMLALPAGMVLYMLTNSLVSIIQQQWINRKFATS